MAVSNEINESKTLLHRVFDSYHNPEENGPFKIGVNNKVINNVFIVIKTYS